jgi:putative FmdB family regulatory protein
MPLFEYSCRDCDNHFELLVRESTKLECPKCAGTTLDKLLSVFAVSAPGSSSGMPRMAGPMPCGSCGDPRGAGSCKN